MNTRILTIRFFTVFLIVFLHNVLYGSESSLTSSSPSASSTVASPLDKSEEQEKKQALSPLPRVLLIDTTNNDFQYVFTRPIRSAIETALTITIIGKNPNNGVLPLCKKIWFSQCPSTNTRLAVFPASWQPELLTLCLKRLYREIVGPVSSMHLTEIEDSPCPHVPALSAVTLTTFAMLTTYSVDYAYPGSPAESAAREFSPLVLTPSGTPRTLPQLWQNLARYLSQFPDGSFPAESNLNKKVKEVISGYLKNKEKFQELIRSQSQELQGAFTPNIILFKAGSLPACINYATKASKARREAMRDYSLTQARTSLLEAPITK